MQWSRFKSIGQYACVDFTVAYVPCFLSVSFDRKMEKIKRFRFRVPVSCLLAQDILQIQTKRCSTTMSGIKTSISMSHSKILTIYLAVTDRINVSDTYCISPQGVTVASTLRLRLL